MGGMGEMVVIDGLAEMVCDGGMIAMASNGSMYGSDGWYNSLLWVVWVRCFVIYGMDEMASHGWKK